MLNLSVKTQLFLFTTSFASSICSSKTSLRSTVPEPELLDKLFPLPPFAAADPAAPAPPAIAAHAPEPIITAVAATATITTAVVIIIAFLCFFTNFFPLFSDFCLGFFWNYVMLIKSVCFCNS